MSKYGNKKKAEQLGMPIGTASGKLRKKIMFSLIRNAGLDRCFQCKERIVSVDDLSIEHIVPWLDSEDPVDLFFSLNNIAFSHLSCNSGASRNVKQRKPIPEHGTSARYKSKYHKCRCTECTKANSLYSKEWDKRTGRVSH